MPWCAAQRGIKERLRGSKVDVSAWGSGGRMTLLKEERVAGNMVKLAWGDPGGAK